VSAPKILFPSILALYFSSHCYSPPPDLLFGRSHLQRPLWRPPEFSQSRTRLLCKPHLSSQFYLPRQRLQLAKPAVKCSCI